MLSTRQAVSCPRIKLRGDTRRLRPEGGEARGGAEVEWKEHRVTRLYSGLNYGLPPNLLRGLALSRGATLV